MDPLQAGEVVYTLNPKYRDGTRLRAKPSKEADFNGIWAPNDIQVSLVEIKDGFGLIQKIDQQRGWIQLRNLARVSRLPGVTKGVVTTEMVTPDPEYVKGIKIYNLGIKEDPVPGQKFGKGLQHLISSQWINAISAFVASHFYQLQEFAHHAYTGAKEHPGYDFIYFTNMANHLFNRADISGLRSQESKDFFLMATWLTMAAAEVDDFPFSKYTPEQRATQREDFYKAYLVPKPGPGVIEVPRDDAAILGKFSAPLTRRDLLPPIAMERLGLNNELSALKYVDPEEPLREGFLLSKRIDSLKRHFEGVHRRLTDEDHITHLLWNFHAIYHVAEVFPEKNDLIDYTSLAEKHTPRRGYEPPTSLQAITQRALPIGEVLKLDWNEGAIPPPVSVSAALREYIQRSGGAFLRWYPHLAGGEDLRRHIAAYCGVIPENLIVTNGSDDALILICHSYLQRDKAALVPVPTYEHLCADVLGTGATLLRLETSAPFIANPDEIATGVEEHRPDVVYLVSPNNPTGVQWRASVVRGLAQRYPETLFIIDEAYYEFGALDEETNELISCAKLATELPNVVVTRTFSKAFCLAALRCGYLIAHPNTIERLREYYNPKSVNQLAQIAATKALEEYRSYYQPYIRATNDARVRFIKNLRQRGVHVESGGAGNFVCIRVPEGETAALCKRLEEEAIFVRDIGARFPGYIRITIGLEMKRVEEALVAALTPTSVEENKLQRG